MLCIRFPSLLFLAAPLLAGCANDQMLKRMEAMERNIATLDKNDGYFHREIRRHEEVLKEHQQQLGDQSYALNAGADAIRGIKSDVSAIRQTTDRLEIIQIGESELIRVTPSTHTQ